MSCCVQLRDVQISPYSEICEKKLDQRYAFKLETHIQTYRKYFESRKPTASKLFLNVKALYDAGSLGSFVNGETEVSIQDISVTKSEAIVLFRLTDPKIQDRRYFNSNTSAFRDGVRKSGEVPAISAHMVFDISKTYDADHSYPTMIENVDLLSRSMILTAFNNILARHFAKMMDWTSSTGRIEKRQFQIGLKHQVDKDQTLGSLLDASGVLKVISFDDQVSEDIAAFDPAYPVVGTRKIRFKVENRPSKKAAKNIVRSILSLRNPLSVKKVRVVIEDPITHKDKAVPINLGQGDLMANAFVPQVLITHIMPELRPCEEKIHKNFCKALAAKL